MSFERFRSLRLLRRNRPSPLATGESPEKITEAQAAEALRKLVDDWKTESEGLYAFGKGKEKIEFQFTKTEDINGNQGGIL